MKRVLACFLFAALVFGGLSAQAKPVIGVLIRNLSDQFLGDYTANLKQLAAAKGVELKVMDASSDQAKQLDQLNTLLSQGIKYFIIVPAVSEGSDEIAKAILAKYKDGGAAFSNTAPTVSALKLSKNFFFASSPESVAGQIQADIIDNYFKKFPGKLGPGKAINAIVILGQLGHPAQIYRTDAVLKTLAKKGYTVNIIAKDTANWQPDEAQAKMDAWLNAYKDKFNVVIANNDAMALGAVESLITANYVQDPNDSTKDVEGTGTVLKVPVLGVDCTQVALKSMSEKKLYATVLQDAVGQSSVAFELAYAMATKGSVYGKKMFGISPLAAPISEAPANDAAVAGQCYLVPFKGVTMDNYQSFISK
jgi:methyl-galactoside transport system substrate-binding protein